MPRQLPVRELAGLAEAGNHAEDQAFIDHFPQGWRPVKRAYPPGHEADDARGGVRVAEADVEEAPRGSRHRPGGTLPTPPRSVQDGHLQLHPPAHAILRHDKHLRPVQRARCPAPAAGSRWLDAHGAVPLAARGEGPLGRLRAAQGLLIGGLGARGRVLVAGPEGPGCRRSSADGSPKAVAECSAARKRLGPRDHGELLRQDALQERGQQLLVPLQALGLEAAGRSAERPERLALELVGRAVGGLASRRAVPGTAALCAAAECMLVTGNRNRARAEGGVGAAPRAS
mmetsp:Transcript_77273/g.250000  ORF Transcript_77273/g.250000 Transcript_77273/m.250000 type:complete len:286 (+) Transcript_77273:276-1133(+)